jgi:hypothetical protein
MPLTEVIVPGDPGHVSAHQILHDLINNGGFLAGKSPLRLKGAVGNSDHNSGGGADDTNAILDTVAEAQQEGVPVILDAGKSYRIRQTLDLIPDTSKVACSLWGMGGSGSNKVVMLPNLVWDPIEAGPQPIINIASTGNNIPGCQLVNFRVAGRDIPDTDGIRWGPHSSTPSANAKPDTGSFMYNVHVAAVPGHGTRFDGVGLTNFFVDSGRMDKIGGYAFYCRVASQTGLSIRNYTWDAWGTPAVPDGKGFLHLDAGSGGATATCDVLLDNVHTEHSSLVETFAGGTTPADRRGVIAATIDDSTGIMHFNITAINPRILGWNSSDLSASYIQMLGGTEDENRSRLVFNSFGRMNVFGDGSASTGHVIPIGNIPAQYKYPFASGPPFEIHYPVVAGGGGLFGGETPRIWGNMLRGTGTPEGAVVAPIGSIYLRTDGGTSTTLYVKESGTGNTGWVGK